MVTVSSSHTRKIEVLESVLKLLSSLTIKDLEAISQLHRRRASDEEKAMLRAKQRERQKAYRATPEGRQKANEASKKSHALAKQRAEEAKALLAQRVSANLEKIKKNL